MFIAKHDCFEVVPNFSAEADWSDRITEIIKPIGSVSLLHSDLMSERDGSAGAGAKVFSGVGRAVYTLVGDYRGILEISKELYRLALEVCDMRQHGGTHPCIGALDVLPVVPLFDTPGELAKKLAQEIAEFAAELGIPVFFYRELASSADRRDLSVFRRNGFKGLHETLRLLEPDLGPAESHISFGATLIGVRELMLAYNVSLDTKSVKVAKNIASEIRESAPSGLAGVKAIGWYVAKYGLAQVSTNIYDISRTSLFNVFDAVERVARDHSCRVVGSEIIGMCPRSALLRNEVSSIEEGMDYLHLNYHQLFDPHKRVIEFLLDLC